MTAGAVHVPHTSGAAHVSCVLRTIAKFSGITSTSTSDKGKDTAAVYGSKMTEQVGRVQKQALCRCACSHVVGSCEICVARTCILWVGMVILGDIASR